MYIFGVFKWIYDILMRLILYILNTLFDVHFWKTFIFFRFIYLIARPRTPVHMRHTSLDRKMKLFDLFFIYLVLSITIVLVSAHSYLLEPTIPRRSPFGLRCHVFSSSSTCCTPRSQARPSLTTYARGQNVNFMWPRNNHPGGFVRLAVTPFSQSDSQASFNENIFHYNCYESGCRGYDDNNLLSGDKNGAIDNSNPCRNVMTIPTFLADGQYTIQWTWYGGSSYFNDQGRGQISYQSCMDFTVSGGPFAPKAASFCPVFKGGDPHFPNQNKCLFFVPTGQREPSVLGCFPDGCRVCSTFYIIYV